MDTSDSITLNNNVVKEVVNSISTPWERIVVYFETIEKLDSRVSNELTIIVQKDQNNKHSVANFILSNDAKSALYKLRDSSDSGSGKKWSTCILVIDPPGKFKFDFSYGKPKILNGILDDDYKYYSKYLPHYLKEKGLSE